MADISVWLLFAVDYTIRMSLAPARLRMRFIRSHLPDLAMVRLPALRPLRILRLLSLGNVLARRSAHSLIAGTGLAVAGTAGLVVYLGAVTVLDAERGAPHANTNSLGNSLWWACSTITTVGYGDRSTCHPNCNRPTGQGRALIRALPTHRRVRPDGPPATGLP